jgi:hypothetical protein
MKTNSSAQSVQSTTASRRQFLLKGMKRVLSATFVATLLSLTSTDAAVPTAYPVKITESSTNTTTIKNGGPITFRGKVIYQAVRNGPWRPVPNQPVLLWLAGVMREFKTDANGSLNVTIPAYYYTYRWSGYTSARVSWHWEKRVIHPFGLARGADLKFTVLK